MNKQYEFRILNATDIAPMCKIIGKIGINNFTKCFESEELLAMLKNRGKKNITELAGMTVAFEVVNIIVCHIPDCENDVFHLLASVSGLTVDEIKGLSLADITEMIVEFVKKEEFKDFISVVSKLFK